MTRFALWLGACVAFLGLSAYGQNTCLNGTYAANTWCQVYANGSSTENGTPQFKNNGWNKAIYIHDLDRIFITGQGNQTSDGTKCSASNGDGTTHPVLPCSGQLNLTTTNSPYSNDQFFGHASTATDGANGTQPTVYSAPPWTEFYSSAITEEYPLYPQQGSHLWLAVTPHDAAVEARPLAANGMQITLCNKSTTCDVTSDSGFLDALPPTGSMSLDDEVFDYSECVAYGDVSKAITSYSGDGATATFISNNNFQAGWSVIISGLVAAFNGTYTVTAATSTQFQVANTNVKTTTSASGKALRYPPDLTTPLPDHTGGGVTASCNQAAYQYVFTVSGRGRRQGAGWTAATTHVPNDAAHPNQGWTWLATPKVLNGSDVLYGARVNTTFNLNSLHLAYGTSLPAGEFDGPTSRHQRGVQSYDPKQGKIWYFMGFQEMTSNLKDLWWNCVYAPASGPTGSGTFSDKCAAGDLGKSYQHANLATTNGAPPCCFTEGDTIYLPDPFDALVAFGGLLSGSHSDLHIMCLSNTSVPVKACHSDGDITNAASYVPRQFFTLADNVAFQGTNGTPVVRDGQSFATCTGTNCHGNPGLRDGPTLIYDPTDEKLLVVGGISSSGAVGTSAVGWTSIAHWNPRTSDYCLSDTSQNGLVRNGATYREFDGAGCNTTNSTLKQTPLRGVGSAPFPESNNVWFEDATWHNGVNKLVVYMPDQASASTSGLFIYDPTPTVNSWTRTGVLGGPPPYTPGNYIYRAGESLVHDDVHNVMTLVEAHAGLSFAIWELADAALGIAPSPIYTLTVSLAGTGSGVVQDSPLTYINCGTQCLHNYGEGASVTLAATPTGGSTFAGWSGACTGTDVCTLTMDVDKNVTANFNPPPVAGATTYSGMTIQGVQVQ